jgi:hypothetical protein
MVKLVEYKGGNGGHGFEVDVDVTNLPARAEALEELSRSAGGVHARAKRIPPELVAQALRNEPFEDYPRAIYACKRVCDQGGEARNRFNQSYRHTAEAFLRRMFHSLTFIPEISFDIENYSEQKEQKALDVTGVKFEHGGQLRAQVRSLSESYIGFRALRTVFRNAAQRDCFDMETVVSLRYLPELLMAAPVWFITYRRGFISASAVEYFCNLGASDQFAYLFQIYNHQLRSFDQFYSRDVMPVPILDLVTQVRQLFDYLVIATPYHDFAAREWTKAERQRWTHNIDPFLLGFLGQIPEYMFFLGRWSGTGMFPLIDDMIADTIQHITTNKDYWLSLVETVRTKRTIIGKSGNG